MLDKLQGLSEAPLPGLYRPLLLMSLNFRHTVAPVEFLCITGTSRRQFATTWFSGNFGIRLREFGRKCAIRSNSLALFVVVTLYNGRRYQCFVVESYNTYIVQYITDMTAMAVTVALGLGGARDAMF